MSLYLWIQCLISLPAALSLVVGEQPNLNLPLPPTESPTNPAPPRPSNESTMDIAPHPSSPWLYTLGNTKSRLSSSSTLTLTGALRRPRVRVECDDYPFGVDASDCRQAWRNLPPITERDYSFGNRSSNKDWDVPLPMRYTGHDGTCAIEIDQTEQGTIGYDFATGEEVHNAVRQLITQCANNLGRAGTARLLGKRGRLSVSLKGYQQHLACDDPEAPPTRIGPMQACQDVLNHMKTTNYPQVFGHAGTKSIPAVEQPLPVTIQDVYNECAVTVDVTGPPAPKMWYDLWADAVAVTGVCVIRGKWGVSRTSVGGSNFSVAMHGPLTSTVAVGLPNTA